MQFKPLLRKKFTSTVPPHRFSLSGKNLGQSALLTGLVAAMGAVVPVQSWAKGDLDVGGVLMMDYATYDGLHNDGERGSDWYVRRARIKLEHDSEREWKGELEIDFDADNEEAEVLEASFEYELFPDGKVYFGKLKESFGLENTTSSRKIGTLERSVSSDVFAPGRSYGFAFEYEMPYWYNNVGIYQAARDDNDKSHYALALRSVVNPLNNENSLIHLGVSLNQRDMAGEWYEVNESIEVSVGDKFVESPAYRVDKLSTYAYESGAVYKRFSYQGEYFKQEIEPENNGATVEYDGYYVSLGIFLSNHRRQYKDGSFDGFEPRGEEAGWELVGRIGEISLTDQGEGMIVKHMSLTLNYYLDDDVRIMLHTATVDSESSDPSEVGDGNSTSLRIIYDF